MVKKVYPGAAIIMILAIIGGCASTPTTEQHEARPSQRSDVSPVVAMMASQTGENPVFLGIAQRRRDRSEEEQAALEHIADQVARYLEISARYRIDFDNAGRTTFLRENIITDWQPERGSGLLDGFEVIDTYQDNDNTYVLASVPVQKLPNLPTLGASGEKPSWVDTPPVIPGYYVAVGVAERRRVIRDSVDFADEAALKGIVMTVLAEVDTEYWSQSRERMEATGGAGSITGSGSLQGFYVLSRWMSPDGQYYYSLAVAPVRG